jgi:putative PIN family toxin of toxin-antitoxin system
MKPRVVLDTNVLVSGLLGGAATDVIRRWRAGDLKMILSPEIMAEYEDVLSRPKFRLPKWVIQDLLAYIRDQADWVMTNAEGASVSRDASDDKFLFAAATGQADWLVSADPDLLDLEKFRNIPIVPPWEFLSQVYS